MVKQKEMVTDSIYLNHIDHDKNTDGVRTLAECLQEYGHSDYYPLHMPGHKRNIYGQMPEEALRMDITEIDGFDNLHQPEGILKEMQKRAAGLYGADETFYLINGSTCGILSAVSAAVPACGHILIARNCHKSVYHACYLRNLTISYLYPEMLEAYDICEAITSKQVEEALKREPDIDAVLIVSPTYEGRIADIDAISRVVHTKGIPLIVDEAHGAHLGFSQGFAENSCRRGADLVIHSVHKTLPAMTQTALLHVNGELISRERLKRFLNIYQSSSPSYVLMASIENALNLVEKKGNRMFADFIHRWERMCGELSTMKHLSILPSGEKQDPGKLLVSVKKTGLSGQQLYDMLLEDYQLQPEMAAPEFVLAMFTIGDTEEGFIRTTRALLAIDGSLEDRDEPEEQDKCSAAGTGYQKCREELKLLPRKVTEQITGLQALPLARAWDMDREWCPVSGCVGRYCSEFINLYPPGIPKAVPGEVIDDNLISWIADCAHKGLHVQGIKYCGSEMYLPVLRK